MVDENILSEFLHDASCLDVVKTTWQLSRLVTKPTMWLCTQQRLRSAWASAQSDQSSLCAKWVAKGPSFLHADSKDSDQTGQMPRLIWVFARRIFTLLVLLRGGSIVFTVLIGLIQSSIYMYDKKKVWYAFPAILIIIWFISSAISVTCHHLK